MMATSGWSGPKEVEPGITEELLMTSGHFLNNKSTESDKFVVSLDSSSLNDF